MNILIQLLIGLVVIGLMFWAVSALSGAFGIPAPIVTVIQVVLVIVVVIWLISVLTGGFGGVRIGG